MSKPNVLFILIDDMGWRDLSCQGSEFYETPNIDLIAEEGMRFINAYASCPVCSPTRASIMTGKYPARVGITQWIGGNYRGKLIGAPYLHNLPLEEKSIAKTFKENGYNTYFVGKWHLGDKDFWPEHHGFDVNIGGCDWGSPKMGYFSPYHIPNLKEGPKGEYLTDRLTNEAINLLNINNDKPFFLFMSYYSVHRPIQAPEENIKKFKEKAIKMGLDKINPIEERKNFVHIEDQITNKRYCRIIQNDPDYAGMIERLDQNIGRILTTIEALGKKEDTIIIFYSDNGGFSNSKTAPTSNMPLREGKSFMYEGGIQVPLLIRWPKNIKPKSICEKRITSTDFYPTLLECCNIPLNLEQHVDGRSFHLSLKNPNSDLERGPIYWHYPHYNHNGSAPGTIVIDGDWKLIEWHEDNELELYNLKIDKEENHNVADLNPEIRDRLFNMIKNWRNEVGALIPLPNPNYPGFLAKKYIYASGKLSLDEDGLTTIKMKIAENNPELYDIPISEIFDPLSDQIILLKIGNIIRTGKLYCNQDEKVIFYDTHEEVEIFLKDLLLDYLNKNILIRGWDKIPEEFLPKSYIFNSLPQIEIELVELNN